MIVLLTWTLQFIMAHASSPLDSSPSFSEPHLSIPFLSFFKVNVKLFSFKSFSILKHQIGFNLKTKRIRFETVRLFFQSLLFQYKFCDS